MDIMLQDGKQARVDRADAAFVNRFVWWSMTTPGGRIYAYTNIAGHRVYMHHLLLGHEPRGRGGGDIDHKNGDGLDNCRSNLRKATRQQNNANSGSRGGRSQFKGVTWNRKSQKWQAHVMVNYKTRFLGLYEQETDAAHAYDLAAKEAFGDFARLNLPDRIGEPAPARFSARLVPRSFSPAAPASATYLDDWRVGGRNPNAKLTEDDVRAIIRELQAVPRRSQTSIAQQFGVRQTMISRIARRENWAHLWNE